MELGAPGLHNELVELRPLTEQHREPLHACGAEDAMWASMPAIERGAGFDVYFDHVLRAKKDGTVVPFAISDTASGNFIGVCSFSTANRFHRRVEIGYVWLHPDMRGRGCFGAIHHLLISRALAWGCRRIGWQIETRNARARDAIKHLGATYEGTLRDYARFADGSWVDLAVFSLLRDEASAVVGNLEARLQRSLT
ncbi:MAG: GNAT family protein [Pseudomonadota bacterium]